MRSADTIVAQSSAPGPSFRGIIRLSGPDAWRFALGLLDNPPPLESLTPQYLSAVLADPFVPVRLLLFAGPRSYTGLDVAELHLPGSPGLLCLVLDQLLSAGARPANPGEFTAQAFFNGKIDLSEAEGIAATIAAQNERQLRAAANLRHGLLHRSVQEWSNKLADLVAQVETGIDFSDELDVAFAGQFNVTEQLILIHDGLADCLKAAVRVDRLDSLPVVVFIGAPNVGKSSLINALAGQDRSMVSAVAGTTRDTLSVVMHTNCGDIRLVDVPGDEDATDELRSQMLQTRQAALLDADWIIRVVAHPSDAISTLASDTTYPGWESTVQNKADLLPPDQIVFETVDDDGHPMHVRDPWQLVSAKTGLHLAALRHRIIDSVLGERPIAEDTLVLNQRHRVILHQVTETLDSTFSLSRDPDCAKRHPELLAADLRHALDLLGQITGVVTPEDILGRIFSTFCIGK